MNPPPNDEHTAKRKPSHLHIDESCLFTNIARPQNAVLVEKIQVKPAEQKRVHLGYFTEQMTLKGFLVEIDPDPDPPESVVTQTIRMDTDDGYKLSLHVANFGSKEVQATVWKL